MRNIDFLLAHIFIKKGQNRKHTLNGTFPIIIILFSNVYQLISLSKSQVDVILARKIFFAQAVYFNNTRKTK
jgi:hypothetical protein